MSLRITRSSLASRATANTNHRVLRTPGRRLHHWLPPPGCPISRDGFLRLYLILFSGDQLSSFDWQAHLPRESEPPGEEPSLARFRWAPPLAR